AAPAGLAASPGPVGPAEAHAALARAGLLEAGELRFTHPMMREAVRAGLVPAARSALHRRAARLLAETGASEDMIAAQLLATDPGGEEAAAALLTRTGERALAAGDVDVALHHLRRAVAEASDPPPERLLALGLAEARAGDPEAGKHLRAAAAAGDLVTAARAQQALARRLVLAGRPSEAADLLKAALARLAAVADAGAAAEPAAAAASSTTTSAGRVAAESPAGPSPRLVTAGAGAPSPVGQLAALKAELEDDLLDGLVYELVEERRRRLDAADERPVVLAHRAFDGAATGAPVDEVVDLARRALADGQLVRGEGLTVIFAIEALMAVEAADESRAALDAFADAARRSGSKVATLGAMIALARWEHAFGDLERAQDAARAAIEHYSLRGRRPTAAMRAVLAAALLDAGDLAGAEAAMVGDPPDAAQLSLPICGFHSLQGRILLERGRPGDALAAIERQFELERSRGWRITLREATRPTYVRALAAAGRLDEARAFAAEVLAFNRARGMHAAEARMLLAAAGLSLTRDDEIAQLEHAVAAADRSSAPLVQAEAHAALGAALRRAGRRAEARAPLRHAR
ncbi:hypothetical protein OJ962_34240, partial [Solirubrobacter sp. CPCC 204708]|nr:hypothetical protein [Solirubrobacter deserti]